VGSRDAYPIGGRRRLLWRMEAPQRSRSLSAFVQDRRSRGPFCGCTRRGWRAGRRTAGLQHGSTGRHGESTSSLLRWSPAIVAVCAWCYGRRSMCLGVWGSISARFEGNRSGMSPCARAAEAGVNSDFELFFVGKPSPATTSWVATTQGPRCPRRSEIKSEVLHTDHHRSAFCAALRADCYRSYAHQKSRSNATWPAVEQKRSSQS